MVDATTAKLSSMHFHGWQLGLKTGMYFLHTRPKARVSRINVEQQHLYIGKNKNNRRISNIDKEEDICLNCGA